MKNFEKYFVSVIRDFCCETEFFWHLPSWQILGKLFLNLVIHFSSSQTIRVKITKLSVYTFLNSSDIASKVFVKYFMTYLSKLLNLKNCLDLYFDHVYYDSDFSKKPPTFGQGFLWNFFSINYSEEKFFVTYSTI